MRCSQLLTLLLSLPWMASCEPDSRPMTPDTRPAPTPEVPAGAETATFGGGCFWCVEAAYRQIGGVISATSGYMGGTTRQPTYRQVCEGDTGHAEVVHIVFDPKKITYPELLAWFWKMHDPTTLNRQGGDVGTQYRSVVFFHSAEQKRAAEESRTAEAARLGRPVVTEITAATEFWPAEGYHQDYYFLNKKNNSYCTLVIEPKLEKLKLRH